VDDGGKMSYLLINERKAIVEEVDKISANPLWDSDVVLSDWDIRLTSRSVKITGKRVVFEFDMYNELDLDTVEDHFIKDKKFLWWSWKTKDKGWCILKKREPYTCEFVGDYKMINIGGDKNGRRRRKTN